MHLIQAFRCPVESIRGCLPPMECNRVLYVKLYSDIVMWIYKHVYVH